MLKFEEFSKLATEYMEKNLGGDYRVSLIKFRKRSGEPAEGLLVKRGKYLAGPGIALDSLYVQYVKMGGEVSDYLKPILKIYNIAGH